MENKKSKNPVDTIMMDVPLFIRALEYAKEDAKTDMDLHSFTERAVELCRNGATLTMDNYNHLIGSKTVEPKESTDAGSSGAFEAPAFASKPIKKTIYKPTTGREQDIDEVTGSGSATGAFDVPAFGKNTKGGRPDPLALGGEKTIKQSRAVTDKNFPKYGGPGGKFVEINPACKTFPYCNQGEKRAVKFYESQELREVVTEISNEMGVPYKEIEKIVLNQIKRIFM